MLFNSQIFLLVFLPLVLMAYWLSNSWFGEAGLRSKLILLFASWVFYAYWDVRLFPLLLFSIVFNFLLIRFILTRHKASRLALYFGIALNLLLLGYFKYLGFFSSILAEFTNWTKPETDIILPLAISFFTFQQISCLVDEYNDREIPHTFLDYALYISFFPQLIAGPIVRHHQLIPQIQKLPALDGICEKAVSGILLITIGLVKKVAIADTLATLTNPIFNASLTEAIALRESIAAITGFSLQIYFDFSGYSDIAIGLALLFGIVLPINFNAPFKASSLIEFWRCWHITLSSFLRDYLYIPLGGSRNGVAVMLTALLITMLLGGLWHGAAWNFVIWGGLHGLGLTINHLWRRSGIEMPRLMGWALTITFVILTFAVFRAETLGSVINIFAWLNPFANLDSAYHQPITGVVLATLLAGWGVVLFAPTSQQLVQNSYLRRPNVAGICAIVLLLLILHMGGEAGEEFIYFQF